MNVLKGQLIQIFSLFRIIFRELNELKELYLCHNRIETIHPEAFTHTKQLEIIDLSHNQLYFIDKSPFKYLIKLKTLILYKNNLLAIPPDLQYIKVLVWLDLGCNNITSLKYGELRYKLPDIEINFTNYELVGNNLETKLNVGSNMLRIFLNNNSIECDCSMHYFLMRKGLQDPLQIALSENCESNFLRSCVASDLSNELPFKCPDECTCKIIASIEIIIICEDKGLTTVPEFSSIENMTHTLGLYIQNNRLTELPNLQNNLHVTIIQVSNNSIYKVKEENLPPNLKGLDLTHNEIKMISSSVFFALRILQKIEIIFLVDNPWVCDCSADTQALIEFVDKSKSLTDLQTSKCTVSSGIYYELSSDILSDVLDDLCFKHAIMLALIVIAVLSFIMGILAISFYKYQSLWKVWFYALNACLGCIDGEELDKDKKFDAFISYSHYDEDFAFDVVTALETGNPSYKICLHERDWLAGQLIAQSVSKILYFDINTTFTVKRFFDLMHFYKLLNFRLWNLWTALVAPS